jgi:hypothetical protein
MTECLLFEDFDIFVDLVVTLATFVGENRYCHKNVEVFLTTGVNSTTFVADFTTINGKNLHLCVALSVFTDKSGKLPFLLFE